MDWFVVLGWGWFKGYVEYPTLESCTGSKYSCKDLKSTKPKPKLNNLSISPIVKKISNVMVEEVLHFDHSNIHTSFPLYKREKYHTCSHQHDIKLNL